ncbi:hypothetical protein Rhe02_97990 [Rhizocola hellebori]|uniref:Uncharacterized protein n=2 Tax=Rhizocola hellebori TaxID=1392758 RepID=A0A8J3QKG0_9ACTN|nr:hypothetical protein Rhe02_97990 [Rhizocola hellebori]
MAQLLDEVGLWLNEHVAEIQVGPVARDERKNVINTCVKYYFDALKALMAMLSSDGLLEYLVIRDEALQQAAALANRRRPHYVSCFGPEAVPVDELDAEIKQSIEAQIANRFLIEYSVAVSPSGELTMTSELYDRVLCLASEIVNKGMLSDALNYSLADPEVSLLPSIRLGVSRNDAYYQALRTYSGNRARSILDRERGRVTTPQGTDTTLSGDLEDAAEDEFGFSFQDLSALLGALVDEAFERDQDVVTVEASALVEILQRRTSLERPSIDSAIKRLTLGPSSAFDRPTPAVYPWRFNRDLSYMRRPLLLLATEPETYVFGMRRIYATLGYWHESIVSARYQAKSPKMKRYLGVARNKITEGFAHSVAVTLDKAPRIVRERVTKIGKVRLERVAGQTLGDIDVLVIDPPARAVYGLEVKDFEVARTPAELSNELQQIVHGEKCTVNLHQSRLSWLSEHLDLVLRHFGLVKEDPRRWSVVGYIVTSEPLVGPLVVESSIPFVTLDEVDDIMNRGRRSGRTSRRS